MMGFDLLFSDKEITAWGGMAVMKRMLEHLKFDAALMACGLPQPGSNRGYRPEQLITQFMLSVWCGANRFEHGEVTRHDPVLKRLFGFKRMANFKAVMRLFNKFSQSSNTLHRLGDKHVSLLRADSGFSDSAFLDHLDQQLMHYVIALRQNQPLQRALAHAQGWWGLRDARGKPVEGIELTRFSYQPDAWSKARWVVGIRQHIEQRAAPKGKTLNLFADDPVIGKWRFSALVTDLDLPAESIWRLYRGRADCENRIKELKYDFAADSFNMKNFWATEATLNTVMLAYNLMSLLRQVLLKTSTVKHSSSTIQHTLQTLRYKLFAKPAYITTENRKPILNLALAMQHRTWMRGLWDASKTFDLPAHFEPLYPSG